MNANPPVPHFFSMRILVTLDNCIQTQVAASSDLMLGYLDFFLGGDEKRSDLPPRLRQRLPLSLVFGGDGSYMVPFSLHSDNILTNLMSQVCYVIILVD